MSKIIEALHGDLAALARASAIDKATMREFGAICPPPVRAFGAADVRRLREDLKFTHRSLRFTCIRRHPPCASGSKAKPIRPARRSSG